MPDALHIKEAFLGRMFNAARRMLPVAGAKIPPFRAPVPPPVAGTPRKLFEGLGGEMRRQATVGAGLGAALEGGINAYTAEDGDRLSAFGRGAIRGGAAGALGGAATATVTAPARNLRTNLLAKRYGQDMAEKTVAQGYFTENLPNAFSRSGSTPRGAAAFELAAAPLALGGEFLVGDMAMRATAPSGGPGGHAQPVPQQRQPQQYAPQQQQQYAPHQTRLASAPEEQDGVNPLYALPLVGAVGGGIADAGVQRFAPSLQKKFLGKRLIPAMTSMALTIPTLQALRPPDALDDVDMDALKYYFGKQPPQTET